MNINFITQSIPSLQATSPLEKEGKVHQFPREISLRIRALNLIAHRVIGDSAPLFYKIIYYFDQPQSTLSYKTCETLFEEAFINEFSEEEIYLFLASFFEKFDPDKEFIDISKLEVEGQKFLWEGVIRYYCQQYIGFETKPITLEALFNQIQERFDTNQTAIKKTIQGQELRLEENFDQAMDIIPQFSADELVQTKLLLISYCAQLITSLKKVEETREANLVIENDYTIRDLFEDIYSLLLELPFLPPIDNKERIIFHSKLDQLDSSALKEKFLSALVEYLLDPQDNNYAKNAEALKETFEKCDFLDFEYREFLQNIAQETQQD